MDFIETVGVYVENTSFGFDKNYTYKVPEYLADKIFIGQRVFVPFSASNKKRQAIITKINPESSSKKLKEIFDLIDEQAILNENQLKLAEFIKERTFCSFFDAVKLLIPIGISEKIKTFYSLSEKAYEKDSEILEIIAKNKKISLEDLSKALNLSESKTRTKLKKFIDENYIIESFVSIRKVGDLSKNFYEIKSQDLTLEELLSYATSKAQKSVLKFLYETNGAFERDILEFTSVTKTVLKTLLKKDLIISTPEEVLRKPYMPNLKTLDKDFKLNDEQQKVYENILAEYRDDKPHVSLIYGVTGSGKTHVFLKLIDEAIEDDGGIIVMVPEISLTSQLLSIFKSRYGSKVAILHSALSIGERLDEYKRIKRGEAKIVIGTRSAVFAPFDKINLIVMDEEHDDSYKSQSTPKYDTNTIAKYLVNRDKSLLILSSATPDIESYAKAKKGIYSFNKITKRFSKLDLPEVIKVDMRGVYDIFSPILVEKINEQLEKDHQVILLINRRGFNTFIRCEECGEVVLCPNCSVAMTYHRAGKKLMCHYCGYTKAYTETCPNCKEESLIYSGAGTQKVDYEISNLFPDKSILRMDSDTKTYGASFEKKMQDFKDGKYQILVGTQMVAKGLDFENVTLVGVLSADKQMYDDDYKSSERTFDLITQVVGRSGRGKFTGKAIIQTMSPENDIINYAANQDYEAFFNREIKIRKAMIYPPFCTICKIDFSANNPEKAQRAAKAMFSLLSDNSDMIIFGPIEKRIFKLHNKYRYQILIKFRNGKKQREKLKKVFETYYLKKEARGVVMTPDIIK
ncbi:MAG: primosomal protein N' [Clostridia bacterium]|nr:primosomal protein N' [Clostridia bacterium]